MESTQSRAAEKLPAGDDAYGMTVGGVRPAQVYVPESAQELAELLGDADRERRAIAPVGGATHLGIGNPPSRLDWIVSTRKLDHVIAYEPPDMTLSIEAGARLGNAQAVLAEHGQSLPIEVGDPARATIGGIVATALYGPKRLGSGTLRDYLIGINVAYADGALAKAGGMVVKNVSGFDLMRMHHGALGTLGVIVSANFKVLPRPRSERTVLIGVEDVENVARLRSVILSNRARPAAYEVIRRTEGFDVAVRIEGRERTTELLAKELKALSGERAQIMEPVESGDYWRDYLAGFKAGEDVQDAWLRMRVKPNETLAVLERATSALSDLGAGGSSVTASPGLGFLDVRHCCTGVEDLRRLVSRLRAHAPRTVVVAAPVAFKSGIDAWGESIESLDLMRALKAEFDPNGTLNPGRYVGGL